jgi:hypothetical protein
MSAITTQQSNTCTELRAALSHTRLDITRANQARFVATLSKSNLRLSEIGIRCSRRSQDLQKTVMTGSCRKQGDLQDGESRMGLIALNVLVQMIRQDDDRQRPWRVILS